MNKKTISVELKDRCIELYQSSIANKESDSVVVSKIVQLCEDEGESISSRTVYRMIQDWKKSMSINKIIESYEVDLSSQSNIAHEVLTGVMEKWRIEHKKTVIDLRSYSAMTNHVKDLLDMSVKIDILKSKKTTQGIGYDESSKIVVGE